MIQATRQNGSLEDVRMIGAIGAGLLEYVKKYLSSSVYVNCQDKVRLCWDIFMKKMFFFTEYFALVDD